VAHLPFEAWLETALVAGKETIRWSYYDLKPALLMQAAELFSKGMTVREVAVALRISKSEAGRLRLQALTDGILSSPGAEGLEVSVQLSSREWKIRESPPKRANFINSTGSVLHSKHANPTKLQD
jgi:hypothetical protein